MAMLEEHRHKHATHNFDGIVENRENKPPVYFTVLFYGLILWAVVFCAFYLLSGWSSDAEFQEKMQAHETKYQVAAAPAAAPAAATGGTPDAKALFAANCAMCHGADGKGGFGSDLTAAAYAHGKTLEAITASIAQGRGDGKMPAYAGQLTPEEIAALADYLLALN
jgi:cytochrome c oxidase cbb3-type subunit III